MTRVYVSSVIDAPVEDVWRRIRDFNAMPAWHPAIADSEIEGGLRSDTVGCVRSFNLTDNGGHFREQLTALSDESYTFTYRIVNGPLPVENYVATLILRKVADSGRTYGEWIADFDVSADRQEEVVELVSGVFQQGFNSLQSLVSGGSAA